MARQDQQSGNNQSGSNQSRGNQGGGNQGGNNSERGFASMDDEKQRAIAAEGGRAAHESGNAHEFTSEEAREAGRKGGQASGGGNRGGSNSDRDMQASGGGNRGGGSQSGNQSQERERDENGQFTSDDRGGGGRNN